MLVGSCGSIGVLRPNLATALTGFEELVVRPRSLAVGVTSKDQLVCHASMLDVSGKSGPDVNGFEVGIRIVVDAPQTAVIVAEMTSTPSLVVPKLNSWLEGTSITCDVYALTADRRLRASEVTSAVGGIVVVDCKEGTASEAVKPSSTRAVTDSSRLGVVAIDGRAMVRPNVL